MEQFEQCPVTEREFPTSEGQDGHIIPEKLGGTTTIRTWQQIDQVVGSRFDSELIAYVRHCQSGRLKGHVTIPSIIDGKLKVEMLADCFFEKGQFFEKVKTNLKDRISKHELPLEGVVTVYLPNPNEILLSIIHSAILFAAYMKPKKQGNLPFFRRVLCKAINNDAISPEEWNNLAVCCHIVCPAREKKTVTLGEGVKEYDHDAVAFNYADTCYGVCKLDGILSDHPTGKLSVFILPK